jgi:hypothetical protein
VSTWHSARRAEWLLRKNGSASQLDTSCAYLRDRLDARRPPGIMRLTQAREVQIGRNAARRQGGRPAPSPRAQSSGHTWCATQPSTRATRSSTRGTLSRSSTRCCVESARKGSRSATLRATSREPLGIGGETIWRIPSLSLPAGEDDATFDQIAPVRGGAVVCRARGIRPTQLRADPAECGSCCTALPAPGWHSARPGVSCCAGTSPLGRADRGAAGRRTPAADGGQPHRAGSAADAAGAGSIGAMPF